MKKTILYLLLTILGTFQMTAQEYEYIPLVREGVKWVYYYENYDNSHPDSNLAIGKVYLTLELKGDTLIDGKSYKALHKYFGDNINTENDTIPIYLREEDKVVYGIVPDGKMYHDCPIYGIDIEMVSSQVQNGKEFILYDFNDPITFCQEYSDFYQEQEEKYEETGNQFFKPFRFADYVIINGHRVKRYVFNLILNCCFIEGIGFDSILHGYLLGFGYHNLMFMDDPVFSLSHVIEDDRVIYRSASEVEDYPRLPIARPDVKWINEHISISDGDTICYYYTYEFKPIENDQQDYNCFYSSYNELNPCVDSIVSLGRNWVTFFECIQNKMLEPIMNHGVNLIDFDCTNWMHKIYDIYRFDKADISSNCILNYYIDHQKENILNRENFVEVNPITIEGISCNRYAYIGEEGDTLAYVVEGIGFDSRDMGDLLTPFTRKPDPDADYQEWCGLSHVVKDGKIIYKGMRYRHGAFDAIDEVVADQMRYPTDPHYYNLMGQPVGTEVPTAPGIYIHKGKKIIVR